MRVLLLVAHPDDETLFGFHDLYYNDTTVICFTNDHNKIRKSDFNRVLKELKRTYYMMAFNDSRRDGWVKRTNTDIINKDIMPIIHTNVPFDLIVSHDYYGEYGHIQHMRVNSIASDLATRLQLPFMTFDQRYSIENEYDMQYTATRQRLLKDYTTETGPIKLHFNFEQQTAILKTLIIVSIVLGLLRFRYI